MNSVEPEPRASARADSFIPEPQALACADVRQENRAPLDRRNKQLRESAIEMSVIAYLGLGANLGDRLASLRAAVHALDHHDGIQVDWDGGIAPVYETTPVGGPPDQPPYLNSVIRIMTTLDPFALLKTVHKIENELGRLRKERWSARTIDIDILLYGQQTIDDDILKLPHPRLHERLFVLAPFSDIAGDMTHPRLSQTILALAERFVNVQKTNQAVRLVDRDWFAALPASRGIILSGRD